MAFKCWQLGLHIQQDTVFIVALQRARLGWSLKRWWQLPLPPSESAAQADDALLAVLRPWRRELPWQHAVSLAFPASRTLQKSLPPAGMTLREREQTQWIASAVSQQLEMPAEALCFDYHLSEPQGSWNVTAAQRQEVTRFQRLASALRLQVAAITPDACALRVFIPQLAGQDAVLAWRDREHWLWASRMHWGHVALADAPSLPLLAAHLGIALPQLVHCAVQASSEKGLDPWDTISLKQPPLPVRGDDFAVAIALAMGAI